MPSRPCLTKAVDLHQVGKRATQLSKNKEPLLKKPHTMNNHLRLWSKAWSEEINSLIAAATLNISDGPLTAILNRNGSNVGWKVEHPAFAKQVRAVYNNVFHRADPMLYLPMETAPSRRLVHTSIMGAAPVMTGLVCSSIRKVTLGSSGVELEGEVRRNWVNAALLASVMFTGREQASSQRMIIVAFADSWRMFPPVIAVSAAIHDFTLRIAIR